MNLRGDMWVAAGYKWLKTQSFGGLCHSCVECSPFDFWYPNGTDFPYICSAGINILL